MAGKVNTKFVIILAVVCAMLAGGAASFYWFVVRKSTSELEAQGDRNIVLARDIVIDPQAAAEDRAEAQEERGKNFRLAAQSYGRAWNRDPRNIEVLLKYIDAYGSMPVKNKYEAQDVCKEIYALMRQATELRPDDHELLEDYYQLLYRGARIFNAPGLYLTIYRASSTRVETDPENLPALKFRGISQAVSLSDDMDRSKQEEIRRDLEKVNTARPEDTDVLHYLARFELYEASRSERADFNSPSIEPSRTRALEYAQQALAVAKDNVQVKVEYLEVLSSLIEQYRRSAIFPGRTDEEAEALLAKRDEVIEIARPVLDSLEAALLQNPDPPSIVQRVASMFPRFDSTKVEGSNNSVGLSRTENLMRVAIEARPDILAYKLSLAEIMKLQLRLDPAHEAYLAARDHDIRGNYEISIRDESLRQKAIFEVANLELIRAEAAEDPEERARLLDAADKAIDDLQTVVNEDYRVLMLRGKVALLRGENTKAMVNIDRASDLRGDKDIEALLLSARARQAEKQWGAATDRLAHVLALVGNNPRQDIQTNVRLQLAEMLIRSREFAPAKIQLDIVMANKPGDAVAIRLLAQWHLEQDEFDQAIATLKSADFKGDPAVISQMADIYIKADQPDQAREILADKLEETPGDVRLLQKYVKLLEDDGAKMDAINRAASAGAEPRAIEILRIQVAGSQEGAAPITLEQMVERVTDVETDEFEQHVRKARIYFQYRDYEKSREAFEKAKALNPKDDRAIVLALDFAILDKDFGAARRIATEAGKNNLDLADGHFFNGRIATAEGNAFGAEGKVNQAASKFNDAISEYEQGFKQRPIFADAWRQYGDLLLHVQDLEKSIEAYSTAVDQKPDDIRALSGLANAQGQLGQHAQALEALRTAVRYAPNNQNLVARYLNYEERFGDSRTVLAMRRELAETQPQNITNRAALAMISAESGEVDEAKKILDDIEAEQGVSRELVAARAGVFRSIDDPEAGKQVILDYIASQGNEVTSTDYILLARYALSARMANDSLDAYRKAIELETSDDPLASREYADVLYNFGQVEEASKVYQRLYETTQSEDREKLGSRLAESLIRSGKPDEAESVLKGLRKDATTYALRSMLASVRGDRATALDHINRSLEKNSRNPMTFMQRANLYATQPATQARALSDVEQAIALDPNSIQALTLQAQLQVALSQPANAARTLRNLLDLAPGNNTARLQLARLYTRNGELDLAEDLIDEGLELDPNNANWLQLGANISASRGDTGAAIASYEKILNTNPNPQLLAQLAILYLDTDKPAAAEALLAEQPSMLNASAVLQGIRGRALAKMNKNDQALRIFGLAIQRSQSQNEVNDVVRQIVASYGTEQTLKLIDQVKQVRDPAWPALSAAGLLMSQKEFDRALERLDQLRQVTSKSDTATLVQVEKVSALCKIELQDYQGARSAYERLLESDPNNVEVLNNLAYIMVTYLDDAEAAVPMAERAAELAPKNAEVLDTLGWTYYKNGDNRNAVRILEESVRVTALPVNSMHLGRVYMDLDEADRARTMLTQAVQLAESAGSSDILEEARDYLQRLGR